MPNYNGVWSLSTQYQYAADWPLNPEDIQSASAQSSARAVFAGGEIGGSAVNTMEFVTIATTGNVTDFGDMTVARTRLAGCSSYTRGVFGGGSSATNVMDYITIATAGNATDFGDLSATKFHLTAVSSNIRGVFAGGYAGGNIDVMEYITIASVGNVTDFGNLSAISRRGTGHSSTTRGVIALGTPTASDSYSDTIEYITIASTGNTTDFGDLSSMLKPIECGGHSSSTSEE